MQSLSLVNSEFIAFSISFNQKLLYIGIPYKENLPPGPGSTITTLPQPVTTTLKLDRGGLSTVVTLSFAANRIATSPDLDFIYRHTRKIGSRPRPRRSWISFIVIRGRLGRDHSVVAED